MKRLFLTSSIGTPGVAESIRTALGHDRPLKTAFITTPIEVEDMTEDEWYQADRKALRKNGFDFFDYTITGKKPNDITKDLSGIQVLYISGGNTNYLLQQSQKCEFPSFIKQFIKKGGIYIGTSAGSIICGPSLPKYLWDDENAVQDLHDYSCYGLVDFTVIPHWGSRFFKEAYLGHRIANIFSDKLQPFVMVNDNQYVEVRDDWYRIVDVRREK